ncbi:MAG: glycogen/starch/alpha-glucan phosphorylase, partial [Paracoccaceae bacterium]
DLPRLSALEPLAADAGFVSRVAQVKRANKVDLSNWIAREMGIAVDPDAMFDVQIKRVHEYKRQLLNILETIALWHQIKAAPQAGWTPRVKIFGGKAAPGYAMAKDIIRLIHAVAQTINADPDTRDVLKVIYPPNYNVTLAERLIPAADLSEQISTAGKEASGTGNMKFTMNGALTIGTLDGANVEIRDAVGADNFFLFGMTAQEAQTCMATPGHARAAIESSAPLRDVLQMVAEGRFAPDTPTCFHGITNRTWHDDPFLVAADFDAYAACQRRVDAVYGTDDWTRMAILNIARSGVFSSDRTIASYMDSVWRTQSI